MSPAPYAWHIQSFDGEKRVTHNTVFEEVHPDILANMRRFNRVEVTPLFKESPAAPELLAALQYFMQCIDNSAHMDNLRGGVMGGAFDMAYAAIAKATGGAQ
jgi:hypothetical protein